jgi:hypothetical protein
MTGESLLPAKRLIERSQTDFQNIGLRRLR